MTFDSTRLEFELANKTNTASILLKPQEKREVSSLSTFHAEDKRGEMQGRRRPGRGV